MIQSRMPFGKYRGRLLSDFPESYLRRVLANRANANPYLLDVIARELRRRHHANCESDASTPPVAWNDIISRWYRELSRRWHPDRGGSKEAMQAINDAHERLRRMVGRTAS
jgi:hypothetical protein